MKLKRTIIGGGIALLLLSVLQVAIISTKASSQITVFQADQNFVNNIVGQVVNQVNATLTLVGDTNGRPSSNVTSHFTLSSNSSAGGNKITNLAPGVAGTDAANLSQITGGTLTPAITVNTITPKNLDCTDTIGPFNGAWSGLLNAADCPGANAGAKIQAALNTAAANGGGIVLDGVTPGTSEPLGSTPLTFGFNTLLHVAGIPYYSSGPQPTGIVQFTGSGSGIVCESPPQKPDASGLPSGSLTITSCTDTAGVATCGVTVPFQVDQILAGHTLLTISSNTVGGYNLTHVLVSAVPTLSSFSFPVALGLGTGTGGTAVWGSLPGNSGFIFAPSSGLSAGIQLQGNNATNTDATNPLIKDCAFLDTNQVAEDIDAGPNTSAEFTNIDGDVFGGVSATDHANWAVSIAPGVGGVNDGLRLINSYAYYKGGTTIPLTSCSESGSTATCLTASTMAPFYASLGGWPGYVYGVTGATGYNSANDQEVNFTWVDSTHVSYAAQSSGLGAGASGALYFGGGYQLNAGNRTQEIQRVTNNGGFDITGPCISVGPSYTTNIHSNGNFCSFPISSYVNEDDCYHFQNIDGLTQQDDACESYDISRAGNNKQVGMVFVSSGHSEDNTYTGNQTTTDPTQDPIYGVFSNKSANFLWAGNVITSNFTAGWQSIGAATGLTYLPERWYAGTHDNGNAACTGSGMATSGPIACCTGAGTGTCPQATEFGSTTNGLAWVCPQAVDPTQTGACGTGINAGANANDLVVGGNVNPSIWFGRSGNHNLGYIPGTKRYATLNNELVLAKAACRGDSTLAAGIGTFSLDCLATDWECNSQDITAAHVPLTVGPVSAGRTFADGVENTTTTLTSATASFVAGDVGRLVVGAGIPTVIGTTASYTYIASVTNVTTVVLSQAETQTATGVSITLEPVAALTNGTGTDVARTVCQ